MCSQACPPFRTIRDESYLQMMNVVSGSNDCNALTINHLKARVNAECNAFVKAVKNVVMDHHKEVHQNTFCQFMHDGATLLNKDKHQAFGIQFSDTQFWH